MAEISLESELKGKQRPSKAYRLANWLIGNTMRLRDMHVDVNGLENIPETGPYIVMFTHHTSIWDGLILGRTFLEHNGTVIDFLGQAERMENPIVRTVYSRLGTIGIKKDQIDVDAITEATTRLKAGRIIGIAPEAGIVKEPEIKKLDTGTGLITCISGADTILVGLAGEVDRSGKVPRLDRAAMQVSGIIKAPEGAGQFNITEIMSDSSDGRNQMKDLIRMSRDFVAGQMQPGLEQVYAQAQQNLI